MKSEKTWILSFLIVLPIVWAEINLLAQIPIPFENSNFIAAANAGPDIQFWLTSSTLYQVGVRPELPPYLTLENLWKIPSEFQGQVILPIGNFPNDWPRFLVLSASDPSTLKEIVLIPNTQTWQLLSEIVLNGVPEGIPWKFAVRDHPDFLQFRTIFLVSLNFVVSLSFKSFIIQQISVIDISDSFENRFPITEVTGATCPELGKLFITRRGSLVSSPGEIILFNRTDFESVTYLDSTPADTFTSPIENITGLFWTQKIDLSGVLYRWDLKRSVLFNATVDFNQTDFWATAHALGKSGGLLAFSAKDVNGFQIGSFQFGVDGLEFQDFLKISNSQVPIVAAHTLIDLPEYSAAVFGTRTSAGTSKLILFQYSFTEQK